MWSCLHFDTHQILEKRFSCRYGLLSKRVLCYICEIAACPSFASILLFSHPCALVLTSTHLAHLHIFCCYFLFFSLSPLHVFVGAFLSFLVQGLSVTNCIQLLVMTVSYISYILIIQHISFNAGFCTINDLASSIIQ